MRGEIRGANLTVEVKGDPDKVAETVRTLITETFNLEDLDLALFRFANMPGQYTGKKGQSPTELSGAEFIASYHSGRFVYCGEQDDNIYLCPPEYLDIEYMPWDEQLLFTKIQDLAPETAALIRRGP